MLNRWKRALREPKYKTHFVISLLFFIFSFKVISWTVVWNETRPGAQIADPILALFDAVNLTVPTFILIYGTLVLTIIYLIRHPHHLLFLGNAYCFTILFRSATITLLPLEAPLGIIPLSDPVVETLTGAPHTLLKDLFYSGHTSALFLFYLCVDHVQFKRLLLVCSVLVGLFVALQKVHYCVDVLAAPFFSYGCYQMTAWIYNKLGLPRKALPASEWP